MTNRNSRHEEGATAEALLRPGSEQRRPEIPILPEIERFNAAIPRLLEAGLTYPLLAEGLRTQVVLAALALTRTNRSKAAKVLGVHRNTLIRMLAELPEEIRPQRLGKKGPRRDPYAAARRARRTA